MVLIPAVPIFNVEVESALLHERFHKLFDQLGLKLSDAHRPELHLVYKIGPAGQINHNAGERLIQRHVSMAEPRNPAPVTECFLERLTENPTHIFNRMVPIDLEIALCVDLHVEMAMSRQLGQHVIEERNTGADPVLARAVQIEADTNVRFVGLPRLCGDSWVHYFFSSARSSAFRNRSFSSGRPIDTLKQRSSKG